jgi:hypothetical protein
MRFKQHLPNYFDENIERFEIEAKDTKDLLNSEKIKHCQKNPEFHKFSCRQYWTSKDWESFSDFHKKIWSRFANGGWHLMAEFKDGKVWYVLGTANELLDLPKWEPNKQS